MSKIWEWGKFLRRSIWRCSCMRSTLRRCSSCWRLPVAEAGRLPNCSSGPADRGCCSKPIVPYSSAAIVDFLQATPEQFCSARTARLMAMAAYQRGARTYQKCRSRERPSPGGEGTDPHPSPLTAAAAFDQRERGLGTTSHVALSASAARPASPATGQSAATTASMSPINRMTQRRNSHWCSTKDCRTRAEEEAIAAAHDS